MIDKELLERLENSRGYMLTISMLTLENKLEHTLITEGFPKLDMLPSLQEVKQLIIKELEIPEDNIPDTV